MPASKFTPGCNCCDFPPVSGCADAVDAKWKGIDAVSATPEFSRKWILFKCLFKMTTRSDASFGCNGEYDTPPNGGYYEVLLTWDSESVGSGEYGNDEVTFIRARTTSPDLEVEAVFDAIPRDDWPFAGANPSNPGCSPIPGTISGEPDEDPQCTFRAAWWLLKTISFVTSEGTFSFTRSEDDPDNEEYGTMVADDTYDCCVTFSGSPIITRRAIAEDDYATYSMTVTMSGVTVPDVGGGELYDCDSYIPYACPCCNASTTITANGHHTSWDGYWFGIDVNGFTDDCGCCDGDTGCLRGTMSIGANPFTSHCMTYGNIECGPTVTAVLEGPTICGSYGMTAAPIVYIPCNDKHPIYDEITSDEFATVNPVGLPTCCDTREAEVTVEEVV